MLRKGDVVTARFWKLAPNGRAVQRHNPTTADRNVYMVYEVVPAGVWVQRLERQAFGTPYNYIDHGGAFGPFPPETFELAPTEINSSPIVIDGRLWDPAVRGGVRKFENGQRVRVVGQPDAFPWVVGDSGPVTGFHPGSQSYGVNLVGGGSMSIPERYLEAVTLDYFGDGAIEGKWSTFDPATPPEQPLDPATQRAIRNVERKGRRIRAVMEKAKREVEHQEARYRALEVGGLPAPSSFVCECGATVAVGATHRCEMFGVRPLRSAGPLDDEHYAKKIRARIEEQERIDAWDENWDDHRPRESQRMRRP